MRYTSYFIPTQKEVPSDAEIVSHQLMVRAGMIRKLTSGTYTYLPAGLRAVRRVEAIIREEMNRAGAIEILMPAVQPAELWQESGRWEHYGRELLRFRDRHDREACFGPTHEEVVTDLVRKEIHSYKQMPINFYQIQTKFRDEIRPRFGIMRAREFIMKDAYSFDVDEEAAGRSYEIMHDAYTRIFKRCGLRFRAVEADTGTIGGRYSHEFMVLAETGEDQIVNCTACSYAANLERAEIRSDEAVTDPTPDLLPLTPVETPGMKTVEEVTAFLSVAPDQLVKTLILLVDDRPMAVLIRGDHDLNEPKLRSLLGAETVELAPEGVVEETTAAPMGFAGPIGLKITIVADNAVKGMTNFVVGGNQKDLHRVNVNLGRDFQVDRFGDLRVITPEDRCPRCGAAIEFGRGIEVGHIFKLGTKYSRALNAVFLDRDGKEVPIIMGCYGIGVNRILVAGIERGGGSDANGIIWPMSLAPYQVVITPVQYKDAAKAKADELYQQLTDAGVEVLLDDRDERPGVKFKDADLIGIPLRIVIGDKGLANGEVEFKPRTAEKAEAVRIDAIMDRVLAFVRGQ